MPQKYTSIKRFISHLLIIFYLSICQTASSQPINLSIKEVLQKVHQSSAIGCIPAAGKSN
jgi:hypothetical protein